jgi:hypothetical protein
MNPRTKRKMDLINNRLVAYGQSTRIINLSTNSVVINTGQIFNNNDAGRLIKRIMNTKVIDWVKNIDRILSGEISEKEIKAISFAIGGHAVQRKHGEKIKHQLNTGVPWNKGLKGNYPHHIPCKETTKTKISEKNSGSRNGMYGKTLSVEHKEKKSRRMKQLILSGAFTPNSNNRNTYWEASLDGYKFRSSWEALYQYINEFAEYETLRIEYELNGIKKIYIVDFVDHQNKQVIEVKPKELCHGPIYEAKIIALRNWAALHNYTVVVATKDFFKEHSEKIDFTRFDPDTQLKIKKLYETNKKN